MRRPNKNHILTVLALALTFICASNIFKPVTFWQEQKKREKVVIKRLMEIRRAEEKYRAAHGMYTDAFDSLVANRLLADSLQYIPYTDNMKFHLTTTVITKKSGKHQSLMECGAKYTDYLQGLDENFIRELTVQAENMGTYPGLKIGDITKPNNNAGNWE